MYVKAKKLGVRGFPTLFFIGNSNNQQKLYGYNPYHKFEEAVLASFPKAVKTQYDKSWTGLFNKYPGLTKREFSELSGVSKAESVTLLDKLTQGGILIKTTTKNGSLWIIKK